MRHVLIRAVGGPEQLAIEPLSPPPEPAPQQVVIDVEAAHRDIEGRGTRGKLYLTP